MRHAHATARVATASSLPMHRAPRAPARDRPIAVRARGAWPHAACDPTRARPPMRSSGGDSRFPSHTPLMRSLGGEHTHTFLPDVCAVARRSSVNEELSDRCRHRTEHKHLHACSAHDALPRAPLRHSSRGSVRGWHYLPHAAQTSSNQSPRRCAWTFLTGLGKRVPHARCAQENCARSWPYGCHDSPCRACVASPRR